MLYISQRVNLFFNAGNGYENQSIGNAHAKLSISKCHCPDGHGSDNPEIRSLTVTVRITQKSAP
jgi:hypothetical protein